MMKQFTAVSVKWAALIIFGAFLSASAPISRPQSAPAGKSASNEIVLSLDAPKSEVHWTLDTSLHTVHGTFHAVRGSVRIDTATGKASGEIVVDATSGQSGNASRDKKMHKDVLESSRFTEVIFRPDRIEGKVPAEGAADVQVHGTLNVHGAEHELTVPVHANIDQATWTASGKFSVPYVQWGMKNPGNFFLRANSVVHVDLELKGRCKGRWQAYLVFLLMRDDMNVHRRGFAKEAMNGR
jgi:polyisoprenoid-binding protein YceI